MRRWAAALPVPTGRLALVAAASCIVVGALPLAPLQALAAVNGLLLLAAFADAALAPVASLRVSRRFPAVVPLGRDASLAWGIENRGARALRVELADAIAPSLQASNRRLRVAVPALAAATATVPIRPRRRGRFVVAELVARVEGPFGLATRQVVVDVAPAVIRVHPAYRSRSEAELRISRARVLDVGVRSARGRGGGTEFDSLREYGADDEFRRIDWSATARAGKPIVRTYRSERNQRLVLLLDTGRVMAGRVDDVPRLEHAMDAVMTLTHVATRLGDRAGLVAFDADVRAAVAPSAGRGQLARVTEAMYELEPRLVESDYAGAFTATLTRFRRRALLVLLTDLAEQAMQETLLPALPLVVRDHVVVLASVQDPEVVAWSVAPPHDAGSAYRRAAAIAALEERRRLSARLHAMGVTVVDAPPGRLAPALADAYLRVKATGRL